MTRPASPTTQVYVVHTLQWSHNLRIEARRIPISCASIGLFSSEAKYCTVQMSWPYQHYSIIILRTSFNTGRITKNRSLNTLHKVILNFKSTKSGFFIESNLPCTHNLYLRSISNVVTWKWYTYSFLKIRWRIWRILQTCFPYDMKWKIQSHCNKQPLKAPVWHLFEFLRKYGKLKAVV